jgi:predicted transposase YbfD/YdcC
MSVEFIKHFATLKDPRHDKNKLHALPDILFLTVAAVVSGANGWEAIEEFGKAKLDWLRRFFPYDNGVPSHDCIRRVFCALSPKALQRCFANWVQALAELLPGEVVAIDGKTLRHSFDHGANLGAIHMVSAWASVNGVCLGQVKTDAKSNEITAIPQLLQLLELKGCIVTLDAMGCQKEIAREIVEQGGDYVLAVKDNQPQLHEMIVDYFETTDALPTNKVPIPVHEETDGGHGRIEYRRYELIADLSTLPTPEAWKGLKAIGRAIRTCHNGEKTTKETRYYIVSFEEDAPQFARAVRQHWGIENELHWVLDVTFREDDSRIRRGYGAENFAVVRHIALNLLKQHGSKSSLAKKRYRAALDDSFRSEVLM